MDENQPSPASMVDRFADTFKAAWQAGEPVEIGAHLATAPPSIRIALAVELVAIDAEYRRNRGETVTAADYLAQVPELAQAKSDWQRRAGLAEDEAETVSRAGAGDAATLHRTDDGATHTTPRPSPPDESSQDPPEIPGYEILDVVASGGMGTVLRARHEALERTVALKVPLHDTILSAGSRERFMREARTAAKLRHPNICPVYDVGEHHGRPYMAMAFIEGPTLREEAKRRRPNPREAAQLLAKLARAVAYAHEHGLIHRDIKPANVILERETGEPMLTDFGLAKEHGTDSAVDVTQSGQILGTPAYMAPEQAAGHTDRIGPACDIYALGAMLFDLLCDRPPHMGTTGEILSKLQREAAPSPRQFVRGLHRDLETICLKALMRDPRDRYASATALADDLERFAAGESILARPTPRVVRLARRVRRHPLVSAAVLALVAALLGVVMLASAAHEQRRLAELRHEFGDLLETFDGSDQELATADALAGRIIDLGGGEPEDVRGAIDTALAERITHRLRAPRLSERQVAAIETQIARLAERDAALASELEAELERRRGRWETVLEMDGDDFDRSRFRREPVPGPVQMTLRFTESWTGSAGRLHVYLSQDAAGEGGYRITLSPHLADPQAQDGYDRANPPPVRELAAYGGVLRLIIERAGVRLRTVPIDPTLLDDGPLRLHIERRDERLSVQLNDLEPLVLHDTFPVRGDGQAYIDLAQPSGYELDALRVARQHRPAAPSPLEAGDALFAADRIEAAKDFYREQWARRGTDEIAHEAQYKLALCQLLLGRRDAAAETLHALTVTEGEHWPALAAMRLWLLRLEQGRRDEARVLFESLTASYSLDRVATYLTDDILERLTEASRTGAEGLSAFLPPSDARIRQLEHLEHMQRVLPFPGGDVLTTRYLLSRAYQMRGLHDRALTMFERMFDASAVEGHVGGSAMAPVIFDDYAALMRGRGRSDEALARVNALLSDVRFERNPRRVHLRIERARLLHDVGRREEAIAELRAYLDTTAEGDDRAVRHPGYRADARHLLGWLVYDDDPGAAEALWTEAFDELISHVDPTSIHRSPRRVVNAILLGSLSGALEAAHVEPLIGALVRGVAGNEADEAQRLSGTMLESALHLMQAQVVVVLRDLCRSDRGARVARDVAFRRATFDAQLDQLGQLLIYAMIVHQCLDTPPSAAQDTLLWTLAGDLWRLYREGQLGRRHMMAAYWTLQGWPREMSWNWLAEELPDEVRARLAYAIGLRYLRLDRPADANEYFTEAIDTAQHDDEPVAALARDEHRAVAND